MIKDLATEARSYFETAVRSNGNRYWRRKDGAPQWVEDLCAAHGDLLPDDYRYEFIVDALDLIKNDEDFDDQQPAHAASELTAWLASNNSRLEYCTEAMEYLMENQKVGMFELLQAGHHAEYREVYEAVEAFLNERMDRN